MFDHKKNRAGDESMGRRIPKAEPEKASAPVIDTPQTPEIKRNRRWFTLGVVLLFASFLVGWQLTRGSHVKKIDVSASVYTDRAAILKAAAIPLGVHVDSVGYIDAIKRIERLAYVKQAHIQARPNGSLLIQVTERQPIARMVADGVQAMVDEDGVMMPVITGNIPKVPILHGFRIARGDTLTSEAFGIVRAFLLAAKESAVTGITLNELTYDARDGVVASTTERGVKVLFGKEGFEERIRHWEAFYGQVVPQKGIAAFRKVDLRYRGQIITNETL